MQSNHVSSKSNAALFWVLLIVIAWLPIPLGSNRVWSWSLMELLVFAIAACLIAAHLIWQNQQLAILKKLKIPLGFLIAWLVFHWVQLIPIPIEILEVISPATVELHYYLYGENFADSSLRLSLDVGETLQATLKDIAYVTLFMLVVVLVNSRLRIHQMAMMLVYAGTANAFFGIINYFTQGRFGFFKPASWWEQAISGTYINPNHFAGLMELCLPIALGLIMAGHQQQRFYPNFKARLRGMLEFMLSRKVLLYLFAVIMFAGIFLSSSRGGIASLLTALVLGLVLFRFARPTNVPQMRIGMIIVPLVVLTVGWFGVGDFIAKLENAGLDSDRGLIREAIYPLIADYPLLGTGAGTFEQIFTLYKNNMLGLSVYDHSHNDYLELLSEQGIIGFLLMGLAILSAYWRIIKCLGLRRNAQLRGILFGVVVGTLSLLIHAWVDFNFQIPANAAIFWCLMGLGISCSLVKSKKARAINEQTKSQIPE